jgi:hypothetical protein
MRLISSAAGALLALGLVVPAMAGNEAPPPSDTVTVTLGGGSETIWPFTGNDFSGTPSDPINLIFTGTADPRTVRDILLGLNGDRTAFGLPLAAFNCTWSDAFGDEQGAWAEAEGWQGGAVQLQCGSFDPLRFHLRLFREGGFTLANAHMDLLIPGTTEHELLSWEVPEALVKADLQRSGFLTEPPSLTGVITPAPTYRAIRFRVFNGVPLPLRAVLGLPLTPQSADVPVANDGRATVLAVEHSFKPVQADLRSSFDVMFNQVIPKPLCLTGPLDLVFVQGPVHFELRTHTNPSGFYERTGTATAQLSVTPVSPTGVPIGPTAPAEAAEVHRGMITGNTSEVRFYTLRLVDSDPVQSLVTNLAVGQNDRFSRTEVCGQ